jgi:hypothetical protein
LRFGWHCFWGGLCHSLCGCADYGLRLSGMLSQACRSLQGPHCLRVWRCCGPRPVLKNTHLFVVLCSRAMLGVFFCAFWQATCRLWLLLPDTTALLRKRGSASCHCHCQKHSDRLSRWAIRMTVLLANRAILQPTGQVGQLHPAPVTSAALACQAQ